MNFERVTSTVNYHRFQSAKVANRPLTYTKFTTLNEKTNINVFPGEVSDINNTYVQYYGVGNGAAKAYTTENGTGATQSYKHSPLSSDLFRPIPFVMRTLDNDLTASERENYALPYTQIVNGVTYRCYLLKKLKVTDSEITTTIYERQGKVETPTPFVPTEAGLYPTPSAIVTPSDEDGNSTNVETSRDVWVENPIQIIIDEWDIEEYKNVIKILYGSAEPAIINELMLVTAGNKSRQLKANDGSTFNFNDALHAQAAAFINVSMNFTLDPKVETYNFDLAVSEPLPIGTVIGDSTGG